MYNILMQQSATTQDVVILINVIVANIIVLIYRKLGNTQLVSAVKLFALGNMNC